MRFFSKLFAESWNIAIRCNSNILIDKQSSFTVLSNPMRYWVADPFLFEHEGHTYIFAELYDYLKRKGVIGFTEIKNGTIERWHIVIEEKYHLSYPYIFKNEEGIFIMPESSHGDNLCIYEALDFPKKWKINKVIRSDVKFADTTILPSEMNEQSALSYDVADKDNNKLLLIDLCNINKDRIIDCDNKESRPAGKIIKTEKGFIRPAQICANSYGEGIVFYKVEYEKDTIKEYFIQKIFPNELNYSNHIKAIGLHTYNKYNNYEVIDLKNYRLNVIDLFTRALNKLGAGKKQKDSR